MTRHFIVAIVLGLAAISCACGDSPSPMQTPTAPTPAGPPPALTVRGMTPSSGPTMGGDFVRIDGAQFQTGATVMIDGIAAPVRSLTNAVISARTPPHAVGTVDVVVMNPDGQSAMLKGAYTYSSTFALNAAPSAVAGGDELTVSFEAPSGRGCPGGGDWIAIYGVEDPDETGASNGHSDLWYEHLCGATSGTFTLSAPRQPGTYEFRYMVGSFSVARSNPIAIR
jgi:hypothetical protein